MIQNMYSDKGFMTYTAAHHQWKICCDVLWPSHTAPYKHLSKPPAPFFSTVALQATVFIFPGQASQLLVNLKLLLKHEHPDYQRYLVFQIINWTIPIGNSPWWYHLCCSDCCQGFLLLAVGNYHRSTTVTLWTGVENRIPGCQSVLTLTWRLLNDALCQSVGL